ncbi:hypothetical protein [Mastigocladopsis repens]|uniref:hypothetical protein n=1 Tax=Mastigocladopsis repens TaxID=221287 RepID=UPI000308479F|nr:hypothetical protein [Mastigocladopsis repens]
MKFQLKRILTGAIGLTVCLASASIFTSPVLAQEHLPQKRPFPVIAEAPAPKPVIRRGHKAPKPVIRRGHKAQPAPKPPIRRVGY